MTKKKRKSRANGLQRHFKLTDLAKAMSVSESTIHNWKKKEGFPHDGRLIDAIEFCSYLVSDKGRRTDLKTPTNIDAQNRIKEKHDLDIQIKKEKLGLGQLKTLSIYKEFILVFSDELIQGMIEDIKECNLSKEQLKILTPLLKKRVKTWKESVTQYVPQLKD